MQAQPIEPADSGIRVAHGYSLKLYVHRGHLIVHDGIGRDRQTRRYHRATSRLKRVVVIGHTGFITLDALRWIHDAGASLVHLDADGQLITTSSAAGPSLAQLRRAQALATTSSTGPELARRTLRDKVLGQASLLTELPGGPQAASTLDAATREINHAYDLRSLVGAEAQAAAAHWSAWSALPTPIVSRQRGGIPEHWKTFGQRHSLLSNGPRLACNPPNAMLNYLYALLEAETTLACYAVGLDPTLGIFHTDQRGRASLALDAMEPIRPAVDAYLLALLTQRTLAQADFAETRQGGCRLKPALASFLAETSRTWREQVAPVVEGIARALAQDAGRPLEIAAPLTRAHHQAAWAGRKSSGETRLRSASLPALPNACRDCGSHLPDRRRRYCELCRAQRWTKHAATGRENAAPVLASLRAEQHDPAHGGRAAELRGRKNAEHQRAVREWEGERPDPAAFQAEILPLLRHSSIAELVAGTGLSEHYCSLIRLGKRTPHARHWDRLRSIGTLADKRAESATARGRR